MAMVDIAMHCGHGPVSLAEIAARQGIDLGYLEQIFIKLRKSGMVKSFRGVCGGYKLAKEPSEITVSEIFAAMGEDIKITRCQNKGGCLKDKAFCTTHHLWEKLEHRIFSYLEDVTLQDVYCERLFTKSEVPHGA